MALLARCLRSGAVPCSDHDPACDFSAGQNGVPPLTGYASWFIARSVRAEPERIEGAWDRLMAG